MEPEAINAGQDEQICDGVGKAIDGAHTNPLGIQ